MEVKMLVPQSSGKLEMFRASHIYTLKNNSIYHISLQYNSPHLSRIHRSLGQSTVPGQKTWNYFCYNYMNESRLLLFKEALQGINYTTLGSRIV